MKTRRFFTFAFAMALCLSAASYSVQAQQPAAMKDRSQRLAPQAASNPVTGSGTPGRLSKWTGVDGANSFSLGNSNIFEDKFGKIGIGTTAPTSLLTVQGMIETTLGGYKFPDGTVQTTAALSSIFHDASLTGNGTNSSPLGIANGGVQTVHLANNAVTSAKLANATAVRSLNGLTDNVQLAAGANITVTPTGNTLTVAAPNALTTVAHDSTLTGQGTAASPLGVVQPVVGNQTTTLLFPFVTNQAGLDTSIVISNTSKDTVGTPPQSGTCTLNYFGTVSGGGIAPPAQTTNMPVPGGGQLIFILSSGGSFGLTGTPGFQGYIIATCNFQYGHGFAFIIDGPLGQAQVASSYLALIIPAGPRNPNGETLSK
jgi:hypothetical protein